MEFDEKQLDELERTTTDEEALALIRRTRLQLAERQRLLAGLREITRIEDADEEAGLARAKDIARKTLDATPPEFKDPPKR